MQERVTDALSSLRALGIAGDDAFVVGSRVTVPLRDPTAGEAITPIDALGLATAISTRRPTLDDVYLRLTGDRLADLRAVRRQMMIGTVPPSALQAAPVT